MSLLVIILHIVVCIALIMIVLLQTGKGADMGAAFGGGASQTLFGATGASTFLSKATTAAAIIFMLTSLSLAYMASNRSPGGSLMPDEPSSVIEQPATDESAAPAETTPSDQGETSATDGTDTKPVTAEEPATDAAPETPAAETSGNPEQTDQ
jgi:preprotein translocase subunit SecG